MSDKVTITQKQADAIKWALNEQDFYKGRKDKLLGEHWSCIASDGEECWVDEMEALNDFTFVQLAIALYVGYEIYEGVNAP